MNEGIRLYRQRRFSQALEVFLNVDADASKYPELSYYLGLCYAQLERYDEALLYLEQVVTGAADFAHVYQARMLLGYIYATSGRHRLARFEFDRIIEEGYESPKAYSALAYALYQEGENEAAIEKLKRALEMDRENANALNSMGYLLAEEERELQYALECCRRAVRYAPNNGAYLDSLGWVFFKLGNVEQARKCLRKALDLRPGNSEIAGHMKSVMEAVNASSS